METVITWKVLHSTESYNVWHALRWWRLGANWQQVQTCLIRAHMHVGAADTLHNETRVTRPHVTSIISQIFLASGAADMHCHQPENRACSVILIKHLDRAFTPFSSFLVLRSCSVTSCTRPCLSSSCMNTCMRPPTLLHLSVKHAEWSWHEYSMLLHELLLFTIY